MDLDYDEIQEFISQITQAIRSIAHGTISGPGGLEGLGMAIAGDGLRLPLSESINRVAESIESVGRALDRIADIAESFCDENREPE